MPVEADQLVTAVGAADVKAKAPLVAEPIADHAQGVRAGLRRRGGGQHQVAEVHAGALARDGRGVVAPVSL